MPRHASLYRLDEPRFARALRARGATLDAVAIAAGVACSTLWRYRNGRPASHRNAVAVAAALGCGVDDLWLDWAERRS